MRRLLAAVACLFVLVPTSASCAALCADGHPPEATHAAHCDEMGDMAAMAPAEPAADGVSSASAGRETSCDACGWRAAADRDASAKPARARIANPIEGQPTATSAPGPAHAARPAPRRARPRTNDPPRAPLALRHAPLLI